MTAFDQATFPDSIRRSFGRASLVILATTVGLLAWAALAPITTTLRIHGAATTLQPVVGLQSAEGGLVKRVHVRRLDTVAAGDLLLEFDTAEAQATRAAVQAQIAMLEAELAVAGPDEPGLAAAPAQDPAVAIVLSEIADRRASHQASMDTLLAQKAAADDSAQALAGEVATQDQLMSLARAKATRFTAMVARGTRPQSDLDAAQEQTILAAVDLQSRRTALGDAKHQSAIIGRQISRETANFDLMLSSLRRRNTELLIDLRAKRADLDALIARAEVRAPVAGTVVALPFDTPGRVARPAEVLVEIAAPMGDLEIRLQIPTRYIDQVAVGQRGTIMLPGLPQRQMPRIDVTVAAIALSAEQDRDGNPTNYGALGLVDAEDLARARKAIGPGHQIVRDMPVVVMLEGQATTPLNYFFDPLQMALRLAFEEG